MQYILSLLTSCYNVLEHVLLVSKPKANFSSRLTRRRLFKWSTSLVPLTSLAPKNKLISSTTKSLSFMTDTVVEVSLIAALCRASISDGTALMLP